MKTCVLIPAYNETKTIGELVKEIRIQGIEAVVIDDGSKDNTSEIARQYGAVVLKNEGNRGKGASLIRGFDYALSSGFEAVICMDGDGQHSASEIPYFLNAAESSNNAVFIGNRMLETKNMPRLRIATNKFMSGLISWIIKQNVPDTQCGFRLLKKELLERLNLTALKYEIESEILIKSARLGFKIESVPVKTIYGKEESQINPVIDTLRFIKFISKELWTTRY